MRDQQILANNAPSFTGCIQDITVNDMKITEEDFKDGIGRDVEQINTVPGCLREEQCDPNPCQNDGFCTDLWSEYQCTCHRPFLGSSCQYNYTGGTFGHENETSSIAIVDIDNPSPYRSGMDISMFIRTREQDGFIFYFGTSLGALNPSYITGRLVQGNLVVHVHFDGTNEKFQVYTVDLSDGYRHFIRVVRMNNSMMVKVNETVSINHEIPSPTSFIAQKLYVGNYPIEGVHTVTTTTTEAFLSTSSQEPNQSPIFEVLNEDTTLPQTPIISEASEAPETDFSDFDNTERSEPVETTIPEDILSEGDPDNQEAAVLPSTQVFNRSKRQVNVVSDHGPPPQIIPQPFKGVIQDIQISDGGNFTRIVELFQFEFAEDEEMIAKPISIGNVSLIAVEKGVVSDNTCAVSPCENGGTCHVTWNDYQ